MGRWQGRPNGCRAWDIVLGEFDPGAFWQFIGKVGDRYRCAGGLTLSFFRHFLSCCTSLARGGACWEGALRDEQHCRQRHLDFWKQRCGRGLAERLEITINGVHGGLKRISPLITLPPARPVDGNAAPRGVDDAAACDMLRGQCRWESSSIAQARF